MVLKLFTLYEGPTVSLLYLIGCVFREVWIAKPACSKASNAETYVVGIGQSLLPS
jgi:cap2 methyltransferase